MKKQKILFCNNYIIDSKKNYSIYQLRLFYYILYKFRQANYFEEENENYFCQLEFEVTIDEAEDIFKHKGLNTFEIREIMMNIPDHVTIINKEGNSINKLYIFSFITYLDYECTFYKFSEECIEFINNIYENFSKIDLYEFNGLKSKYSQRMYELSCRYVNQKNYTMRLDVLRKYFNIPPKYNNAEVKRSIVDRAIKEINNNTRIKISCKSIIKEKMLSHIQFEFAGGYKNKDEFNF